AERAGAEPDAIFAETRKRSLYQQSRYQEGQYFNFHVINPLFVICLLLLPLLTDYPSNQSAIFIVL
ncbi:hypothetical protein, partial [Raoultella planticola]|uniref:hypothetical protein n=1 Tax=Raoultella planticola TaxID=575 RepID=UPI003CFCCD78